MSHYELEPEVAGGWGANTEADTTLHPPEVKTLHFEFSGWLGDCLIESFPCFIATTCVVESLEEARISGFETCEVEITASQEFKELYPQRELGCWKRLMPTGVPGETDIAVSGASTLVVSDRALQIFKAHGLQHCDIEEHEGEQGVDLNT